MDTISKLAYVVNENLKIEGLLRTMYDPRNRLSNEVSDQLKKHFGSKVYRTVIPRNVRLPKRRATVNQLCTMTSTQLAPKRILL